MLEVTGGSCGRKYRGHWGERIQVQPGRKLVAGASKSKSQESRRKKQRFPTAERSQDPVSKKKPCRTAPILEIRGGTCIEDPPIYEREVHSLGSHPSSGFGSKMIPVLLRDSPTLSLTPSPQIWDVVFIGLLQESIEEVCRMTGPVWGRSAFAARCAKWKGTCTSRSLSHAVAC
jgi:hypothetical protein